MNDAGSDSNEDEPSTPEYSLSPSDNAGTRSQTLRSLSSTTLAERVAIGSTPQTRDNEPHPLSTPEQSINLHTMRELLRSHQQDIIDQVLDQLNSQNHCLPNLVQPSPSSPHHHPGTQPSSANPTLAKIVQLEAQLAQLQGQNSQEPISTEPRANGMSNPAQYITLDVGESASGVAESVEVLFPGVERSTLVQIIENRFTPTNIYRLLASEKNRAETNKMINIGGIEFEQTERDGKERDYRMSNFFKAWAAYTGILIKLAPYGLQGELATALCIYIMNLYDVLEKYTWDRVKAYHIQFHRKRVASGKSIYQPAEWREFDSQLIASKCFAYPVPRPAWSQVQKPTPIPTRRTFELPIRESLPQPPDYRTSYPLPNQTNANTSAPSMELISPTTQPCRNWNYRECSLAQCRYQHACINRGSSHRVYQCPQRNAAPSSLPRNGQHCHKR